MLLGNRFLMKGINYGLDGHNFRNKRCSGRGFSDDKHPCKHLRVGYDYFFRAEFDKFIETGFKHSNNIFDRGLLQATNHVSQ